MYLRTGELLSLQLRDLQLGRSSGVVTVRAGKSGLRNNIDEAVAIYDPLILQIGHLVQDLPRSNLSPHALVWDGSASKFRKIFSAAIEELNLSCFSFKPYSLRRGGATADYLQLGVLFDPKKSLDELAKSSPRFAQVDSKLASTLTSIIMQGGEAAQSVKLQLRNRTHAATSSSEFRMVSGREILSMILSNFRTHAREEVMFTVQSLHELNYPGDNHLDEFLSKWFEILNGLRPGDVPTPESLKDTLFRKIRFRSQLRQYAINEYDHLDEDDPKKNYDNLILMIQKYIAKQREERLHKARTKYANEFTSSKRPSAPAKEPDSPVDESKDKKKDKPKAKDKAKDKEKDKSKKENPTAPVLPSGKQKEHSKGKGRGRSADRKPSKSPANNLPKSQRPCFFHFNKTCSKGKSCEFSHDKKVNDAYKKRSRSGSSNKSGGKGNWRYSRSSSGGSRKPDKEKDCYKYAKGKCTYGDGCKYKHDPSKVKATPVTTVDFDGSDVEFDDEWSSFPAGPVSKKQGKRRVQFGKIDIIEYDKLDFCEPTRSSRREWKGKWKYRRSTESIMKDGHERYMSKLAVTKAKAMGFIMDQSEKYKHVNRVVIIAGPEYDLQITMNDPESESGGVMNEEMIRHVGSKERGLQQKHDDGLLCITVPATDRDRRFIMDTGSGHDLISKRKVDRMDLEVYDADVVNFHTANGVTSTTTMAKIDLGTFDDTIRAHVLEDTPSVLSVGKRCMDEGFTFTWPMGSHPLCSTATERSFRWV